MVILLTHLLGDVRSIFRHIIIDLLAMKMDGMRSWNLPAVIAPYQIYRHSMFMELGGLLFPHRDNISAVCKHPARLFRFTVVEFFYYRRNFPLTAIDPRWKFY